MQLNYTANIQKLPRHYLPEDFTVSKWEDLEPWFLELVGRDLNTLPELEQWLLDLSELEAAVNEDACWRQIKMTCDTSNQELEAAFTFFCTEIQPRIQPLADTLNRKLLEHPLINQLDAKQYGTYLRGIRKSIELFRESNIPIQAELAVLQQQFGAISGKMTVLINGNEYTLQQAAKFLEHDDRMLRETAWRSVQERRLQDRDALDQLFDQLVQRRNQLASNAGYADYVQYRFRELGRFDYNVSDCKQFHQAVQEEVVPLVRKIYAHKKQQLQLSELRPWDLEAEVPGLPSLTPFQSGNELLEKSITCFDQLRPFFGDCLRKMRSMNHLDLESRKGKAPGGYNCPLPESGAPFIFMNAAGQMNDLTTMVHEGGHAIHSFLAHPLPLTGFKEYPMEIAEVASMSMELISMDHWDVFFSDPELLKRAKIHQLERVITLFPWIAIIDEFQHWIYSHNGHTAEQRRMAWMEILSAYTDGVVDYSGLEPFRMNAWQRQLHLFEVPFYYIEYGIAQLGAIGMWKQFRENRELALDRYCAALQLGGTATLPELYQTAGLQFDFSKNTIRELMQFVQAELDRLTA